MSGLLTYRQAERETSALCGYGIRQAGVQGYLTTTTVTNATNAQDLIDAVNAAIVSPGAEADSQRNSIVRCIREGAALGDLSDARIQASTTVESLAQNTWVSDDPATGHLGTNLVP